MNNDEKVPGNTGDSARENLRVIRELMERATVYRAISAVPALAGGALSMGVSVVLAAQSEAAGRTAFVFSWLGVLILAGVLNTWLLFKESNSRAGEFPSPQMIHGVFAMGPPMIFMGCIGLVFAWFHGEFERCALFWAMGYGLGLLATSSFAPKSIKTLGWCFLLIGFVLFLGHEFALPFASFDDHPSPILRSSIIMGMTFGLLHLIYGLRTGFGSKREA